MIGGLSLYCEGPRELAPAFVLAILRSALNNPTARSCKSSKALIKTGDFPLFEDS